MTVHPAPDDTTWQLVAESLAFLQDSRTIEIRRDPAVLLGDTRRRLERFLADADPDDDRQMVACRLLFRIHQDQTRRLHQDTVRTAHAADEVRRIVGDLIETDTDGLIDQVPQRICRNLSFGRAMISSIATAVWIPRHLHIECDDSPENSAFLSYVDGARIPLAQAPLETEIVRTRTSAMSSRPDDDRRTFKTIVEVAHCDGYVAAPIMSRGRVIGILHADRPNDRSRVRDSDLAILSALGECLSSVFERAILEERLRRSSARVDEVFGEITAELSDIAGAPAPDRRPVADPVLTDRPQTDRTLTDPGFARPTESSAGPNSGFLTAREREVLTQMATGATNAQIALALVISEETVKSHLKQISKKLGTTSRAAAVARFAQLSSQACLQPR
ncbi:LuxR C-terminal-related transcriptional regulator [Gordonia sp. NB41Y]|uniref:helix-turn-helix transcriptional regulator n=1 Tax=Gordonia sp. NB41Y TaxID=875808 RepID=UPI00273AF3BB|nr:LuxR C-terminal-related transcriptional regulator [Gordonia sp. NB41Y]WLP89031.1 LuxR C-terminal-related transcriptional regulator [Gordonia sp. NB41Y]